MSLQLIATPIGNPKDITLRAIEALKEADIVVGEERKEVSKLLKALGIEGKRLELLNEHSREEDVRELLEFCRTQKVALVTDCGTPGFCDPGSRLVAACRSEGLSSTPLPGASSLMCLLSISGQYMREFLFRGFLPAEREARGIALRELDREKRPVVLMDTPYRLGKLLGELAERWPERRALLGCDFTQPSETIVEAKLKDLPGLVGERKAEFVLALFPDERASTLQARPTGAESHASDRRPTDRPRSHDRDRRDRRDQRDQRKPGDSRSSGRPPRRPR